MSVKLGYKSVKLEQSTRLRLGPVMQRKRRFMNLAEPGTIRRCGVSLGDVLWLQSLSGGEQISRLTGEDVPSPPSARPTTAAL